MEGLDLIVTLTGGLFAALILGYFSHRAGLSPIVGYLLAGIVVGPHTPGFVGNQKLAEQLAEIGVVLLMFGVGLHFHFKDLVAVWRVAIPGSVGQSLVATALGALAGWSFGWNLAAGVVFGLAISVASTVVLVRVLADNRDLHSPTGHIAVGWLVAEDLFTVVALVLLPALVIHGDAGSTSLPWAVGLSLIKIGALVGVTFLVGEKFIPWVFKHVSATRSRELFTLTVLVVALGIATGSAELFGSSMALGAFLAGMVVGRSEFSLRAATEILPMRDAFAVLFFVSVGMLFNPMHVLDAPWQVAAALAVILLGKPLAAFGIVWLLRYPIRVGLAVAGSLAQIGEFSFMLGLLGQQLGVLTQAAMDTIVAASIISISLNPLLYPLVRPAESWLLRHPHLWRLLSSRTRNRFTETAALGPEESVLSREAVVIGYGPVGRTVTHLLRENGIHPTVVELNLETVKQLQKEGVSAVYGDGSHRDTLERAGVERAISVILSSSNVSGSEEVIRLARELNPAVQVLARSSYIHEVPGLKKAGAKQVISAEAEVALALTVTILQSLGATPDQIDQERERVYSDLFGRRSNETDPDPHTTTPIAD
jgi:monovalent cation:H+ antiporter-2, CPA2 family